ncbi:MAG: hypothetical protein K9W45_00990 [Candidatus Heimdallarchaeum aukensis]|uniref:Uncharacterized protein n=1 Tax=Candidatus Heimdallarchaeum aukensis TaxID=2876573 RepID=A0A9Y1FL81_9ARCH|nr:MAG: hypothetical protein K9W45_00990 [Candidatus Heimdallarchaeum aukensis]
MNFRKISIKENLLKMVIPLVLFIISITVRLLLRKWFYANYDVTHYISEEGYYWETYLDADTYYQYYLYAFKHENWLIYDPSSPYPLSGYVYGPLFVYFLTILSYFVGIFFPNSTKLEIAWKTVIFAPQLFDSLSTVVIYYIIKAMAKEISEEKVKSKVRTEIIAISTSIIFIFMPVVLFYNNFLYLNSYMYTFYALLAFLFLIKEKFDLSAFWLAISIMTKQLSLFLLPLWFLYIFRIDKKKALRYGILTFLLGSLLSLPWIVLFPESFLVRMFFQGTPKLTSFSIEYRWILWSTTPFHAFLYWGWDKAALFYFKLNQKYIPFIIFNVLSYFWIILTGKKLNENKSNLLTSQALFALGMHIFLSRGCYKYYDAFFIPFVILALGGKTLSIKRDWLKILYLSSFSIWIFFLNLWIVIKIKWLHQFYVFLIFLTVLLLIDEDLFLYLFKKEAYSSIIKEIDFRRK